MIATLIGWLLLVVMGFVLLRLNRRVSSLLADYEKPPMQDSGIDKGKKLPNHLLDMLPQDGANHKSLVLITSITCDMCKRLYPVLKPIQLKFKNKINILLLSVGDEEGATRIKQEYSLEYDVHPVEWASVNEWLNINHVPFAFVLSPEGEVLSKGLVNARNHIEYLLRQ